ncbi:serine hydrolase domain-containing protein [Mycoplasmatota bacterium WC44]
MKEDNLKEVDELLKKYDSIGPGIAIMAIKNGDIKYRRELGLACIEHNIKVNSNTAFNIASITKQFTGFAIMLLSQNNLLNYDDLLISYLPELKHYSDVTIRNLLNNTSGIENYYDILSRKRISPYLITNSEVLDLLIESKLLFTPGTMFDYSNSNYVLLSIIVERVSKRSFIQYIKEEIFVRLGMNNSYILDENQSVIPNRAYGYKKDESFICDDLEALTVGDGGIYSTLDDLYLWAEALNGGRLITKGNLQLAFTPALGKNGEKLEEDYGFGWSIDFDTSKVWHTGLYGGFRSVITRYTLDGFTVLILSNSSECSWEERKSITSKLYKIFN